jgi:hypothetical protein
MRTNNLQTHEGLEAHAFFWLTLHPQKKREKRIDVKKKKKKKKRGDK